MPAIRTNDGRLVDPFNPRAEDVRPRVMIHSISKLDRFTGHGDWIYTVGQHEYNLYRHVPKELRRAALAHDLSEAWFNDLASPVKAHRSLKGYKREEHKSKMFICNELGVTERELDAFDHYDKAIYINERNALFANRPLDGGMGDDRVGLDISAEHFEERPWRTVRACLWTLFTVEFGQEVLDR